MAGGAGSLITVVRAGPDPSAAPQQKKTHISQTHSVTSCRSSVVRLNKYAAFDVCCVIFIYFFASRLQADFSIYSRLSLCLLRSIFSASSGASNEARSRCPGGQEFRSSPTQHILFTPTWQRSALDVSPRPPFLRRFTLLARQQIYQSLIFPCQTNHHLRVTASGDGYHRQLVNKTDGHQATSGARDLRWCNLLFFCIFFFYAFCGRCKSVFLGASFHPEQTRHIHFSNKAQASLNILKLTTYDHNATAKQLLEFHSLRPDAGKCCKADMMQNQKRLQKHKINATEKCYNCTHRNTKRKLLRRPKNRQNPKITAREKYCRFTKRNRSRPGH